MPRRASCSFSRAVLMPAAAPRQTAATIPPTAVTAGARCQDLQERAPPGDLAFALRGRLRRLAASSWSRRIRNRSRSAPARAAASGTGTAPGVTCARVRTAASPTSPKAAITAAPANRLRCSRIPANAPTAAMTSSIPATNTALSAVPNKATAQSFTPGGTSVDHRPAHRRQRRQGGTQQSGEQLAGHHRGRLRKRPLTPQPSGGCLERHVGCPSAFPELAPSSAVSGRGWDAVHSSSIGSRRPGGTGLRRLSAGLAGPGCPCRAPAAGRHGRDARGKRGVA